jgi:lipopolysaccharide export system permease protein
MARPTVRILSRYLLRQHLAPLLFALAALTCFLLIQQVARQLGNLVGKGLPWGVIVDVFVLSIPFIVATTLPMAVLVAVLYAFTQLAGDNEITAMKAGGVSVGQLLGPVLGGAALVGALAFLWNDQVLPRSNHSLRMLLVDIQRKKPSFSLREQIINEVVAGQFFLRAARIDPASNKLKDVTIYDLGDAERRRIISADSGRMAYTPGGQDLYLTLRDGDIRQVDRTDPTHFNRTAYHTNRIRVAGIGNTLERTETDTYRSDREMTICAMRAAVRSARREVAEAQRDAEVVIANDLRRLAGLARAFVPPAAAPVDSAPIGLYCRMLQRIAGWLTPRAAAAETPAPDRAGPGPAPAGHLELPHVTTTGTPPDSEPQPQPRQFLTPGATAGAQARVQVARDRQAMFEIEIHKKLALAAACIVFALLGVPVAIHFPRGGIGLVIGVSLVVFTIYYVGLIGGEELGNRRTVSPFFAMWTANVLFTAVALAGLALARRPGHSSSGAGWADVKDALVRWTRWHHG